MSAIELPAELSIAHLEPLRAELALAAATAAPIVLSAAAVERVDTAALQLLCALVVAGHAVQWQSPSARLVQAAELLGVIAHLGLQAPSR